eukprot:g45580.t1
MGLGSGYQATISAPHMNKHVCSQCFQLEELWIRIVKLKFELQTLYHNGRGKLGGHLDSEVGSRQHAHALECLNSHLYEGARALDVGSGSGYLTACMAKMVGATGTVVGIDHIQELVEQSVHNVQSDNATLLSSGRLTLIAGDGRRGYPEGAPYDAIHVGAAAAVVPQSV